MLSPQPQLFLLGPESIILYNTAYGRLLRDHHPEYQGRPIHLNEALIAQTKAISRIKNRADTRTQPANENHVPFFMANGGQLEEVFLSATMIKLPQQIGGFHATTYDTTSDAVRIRRDQTLNTIITTAASVKTLTTLWTAIIEGIAATDGDIAFAVLYSAQSWLEQDPATEYAYLRINPDKFLLHDVVGDFRVTPATELDTSLEPTETWISSLKDAVKSREPCILETRKGTLPHEFSRASCERCYGDECREAIVLPTNLRQGEDLRGFLVLGLPPRRPYDET